jgi:hypothetical protein
MPRIDELTRWERELIEEQERIARELEPLLSRRDQLRAKLELIHRLKGLEQDATQQVGQTQSSKVVRPNAFAASRTVASDLQAAVFNVLRQAGKPLHVREIREALQTQGVTIPGKGTDANIIVHLRRAPDVFERKRRGIYSLKASKGQRKREDAA